MKRVFQEWQTAKKALSEHRKKDWEVVLELLRQTDNNLFLRMSNKMLNHLCWSGIEMAEQLRQSLGPEERSGENASLADENKPLNHRSLNISMEFGLKIFKIAEDHLGNIHVSDFAASQVSVFDPQGRFLGIWGRAGAGRGEFAFPAGLCADQHGSLYVVDLRNHRIQQFKLTA